ncbi:MAG: RHS repeat-associated core domain-containing protein [Treponema sp.]|jgi:RHS repeat-associated protein|nr:RHS repeat-associated core domain-containing protein [Treponema sp.]
MSALPKPVKGWEYVPVLGNTGKELDEETGLYYYGARYLDPKVSRWLSADPAMGDYIPSAPVNDEARRRNGSLPGQGGVFNYVNLHAYHYAGNNPVKYVDPDGRDVNSSIVNPDRNTKRVIFLSNLVSQKDLIKAGYDSKRAKVACVALTLVDAVLDYTGEKLDAVQVGKLFDNFYSQDAQGHVLINSNDDVQNKVGILNKTLEFIGRSDLMAEYYDNGFRTGADYTERRGKTIYTDSWHSQLGDRIGNFLHDPWQGGHNRNKPETTMIEGSIFFRKQSEERSL